MTIIDTNGKLTRNFPSFSHFRTHQILEKFSLTHFLCYGSLWGQIRIAKLLPWHPKSELCLFNEELMGIDEAMFISAFFKNGMHIKYVYAEGYYRVEDKTLKEPCVELYVFERDKEVRIIMHSKYIFL